MIPDVQFEHDSSVIKPVSFPVLDNAIKIIKEWGDTPVEVAGHADKTEASDAGYNLQVSDRRAHAVREYLISKGIDGKRLTAKGYGFAKPVADNDPKLGNPLNRRVELVREKK